MRRVVATRCVLKLKMFHAKSTSALPKITLGYQQANLGTAKNTNSQIAKAASPKSMSTNPNAISPAKKFVFSFFVIYRKTRDD